MALLPNKNVLDGSKVPATTTAEMKTALGTLRDFLAGLLGTDSTDTSAAQTALGATTVGKSVFVASSASAARDAIAVPSAIQSQTDTAFTTAGTSAAFTLTPTTAIAANAANIRFNIKLHTAPTGSPTLAVSGKAPLSLKYYDAAGVKQFITSTVAPSGWISDVIEDGTDWVMLDVLLPSSGTIPFSAVPVGNALVLTLNPCQLDFRSATLSSGAVSKRTVNTAITLTVSSGSTLGTVSGDKSRIMVLAIDNAGTVELAVVNSASGNTFDESGLISTLAEGGVGAADSASIIYANAVRSNVPYRVVGYVDFTQATAGTWVSTPTLVQPAGGLSAVPMASTNGAKMPTTAGTNIDVSIPTWASEITVTFFGVSTNGTNNWQLQIGDGSLATTGYTSGVSSTGGAGLITSGFALTRASTAASVIHGTVTLRRGDRTSGAWAYSSVLARTDVVDIYTGAGSKTLSGVLDRISLTTVGSTDAFDAGYIYVTWKAA